MFYALFIILSAKLFASDFDRTQCYRTSALLIKQSIVYGKLEVGASRGEDNRWRLSGVVDYEAVTQKYWEVMKLKNDLYTCLEQIHRWSGKDQVDEQKECYQQIENLLIASELHGFASMGLDNQASSLPSESEKAQNRIQARENLKLAKDAVYSCINAN